MLRIPSGVCGEWVSVNNLWHRRLDALAFVWLRDRVRTAIESSGNFERGSEALGCLREIESIGLAHGAFTSDELTQIPPAWYSFNANCPYWADEY